MFFVRIALSHARNSVSSAPDRPAKSAASTYAVSCRPSDRTACEQPSFWLAMPAITPARAFVPYAAAPVRAKTRAAASVRR